MFTSDTSEYSIYIFETLDGYERFSVLFDSGKSVEVLDEVFATLENTFTSFVFYKELSVFVHDSEDFSKSRNISSW
jgi:hypothetical protein